MIDVIVSLLLGISYITLKLATGLFSVYCFLCICFLVGIVQIVFVGGLDVIIMFFNNSIMLCCISLLCSILALIIRAIQLS